eukprot:CAMPEP_0194765410 /NCGR_PEP_ID=MMETSP0323_2-20130528/26477_1 /TAXON_ID=2866 ORGANISM="Crypthecodinium cohnii, Strain Seligo" /NCGR_SAMPLE_ID=MMETSP0323_2 /ASSEMBLY_ACC=CAM_ASM_000346 /LENGTH=51 /DNA_ID=CAMNT_0039694841 /DNA_START=40 /DNA_END=198 /DNA_ORIENTATION=+
MPYILVPWGPHPIFSLLAAALSSKNEKRPVEQAELLLVDVRSRILKRMKLC